MLLVTTQKLRQVKLILNQGWQIFDKGEKKRGKNWLQTVLAKIDLGFIYKNVISYFNIY